MKYRIKTAWHALLGRPLIANWDFANQADLRGDNENAYVYGCHFHDGGHVKFLA